MPITPCRLCGYDAPGTDCPTCRLDPEDPSLARAAARGPGGSPGATATSAGAGNGVPARGDGEAGELRGRGALGALGALGDGIRAIPMGYVQLSRTPKVRRLLLPPVLLTSAVFAVALAWLWKGIDAAFASAAEGAQRGAGEGDGWIARAVRWTLDNPALGFLADIGHWIFVLGAGYLLATWTFSLVYEALAGPFLDEIQARLEARWFGLDPRQSIERPTALSSRQCLLRSLFAGLGTTLLAVAGARIGGRTGTTLLIASPAPLLILATLDGEYRRWLRWVLSSESSALWVSLKATAFSGLLLVLFFWVKFIPVVGLPLFFAIAGFATALGLLDIPFSRRRWSFAQRLRFLAHHAAPLTAFGLVASVLFVFLPLIGLLVTVPLSSIGGLWLICRLDKSFLRA